MKIIVLLPTSSVHKFFENVTLKRILEIQTANDCDMTGISQHGFKQKRGTSTLGHIIQSLIARALDEDNYIIMKSLDLITAFDVVEVKLLMKMLKLLGFPSDLIRLVEFRLTSRLYYISFDGSNSILFDLLIGTVQGLILSPVLYTIFYPQCLS
jgi:hypothetical protein